MLDNVPRGDIADLAALVQTVLATGYAFTTPTPATHARVVARPGKAWARDLRDVLGWSRPFHPEAVPGPIMAALAAAGLLDPWEGGWRCRLRLSTLDGAGFLHSAYPTTAPDSVFFGPDTYRFAAAIQAVLAPPMPAPPMLARPVRRAVDIGCGAGPGAVTIARAHPAAEVWAVDINDAALRLACANAAAAGVAVHAVHSDLLSAVPGPFDLIVANPPYMADPARRAYRDGGGPLGASLSLKILAAAIDRLAPGGQLLLYTGAAIIEGADPFRHAAETLLAGTDLEWRYREIDPDVFGEELETDAYAEAERIAAVVLTVTRRE